MTTMQTRVTYEGLQPYLSFLGTFVQMGATLLLYALFLLLRRYARRRHYFRTWSYAWGVLAIALAAVILRYNLPVLTGIRFVPGSFDSILIYLIYQIAKFSFYGLLVAGTLRYVRALPDRKIVAGAVAFMLAYCGLSVWLSDSLNDIVVWQSAIAVVALAYGASLMLRLPPSRRSVGSSIIGNFMAFGAVLWAIYFTAFSWGGPGLSPFRPIVNYNTYLDLLWHLSLGFGMVVLLLEDVKHESDAAHAELAVAHDNLRRASFYDSVTGSLNRQAYADGLGLEAATAVHGTVLMLDMDNLKQVNDEYGHAAGDIALRYLAEVLRSALRASDKLYRWGGDEFMCIFPTADTEQVCRRIKRIIEAADPVELPNGGKHKLHVSVGGAHYLGGEDLSAAIDEADRAMYADKASRKKGLSEGVAQSA